MLLRNLRAGVGSGLDQTGETAAIHGSAVTRISGSRTLRRTEKLVNWKKVNDPTRGIAEIRPAPSPPFKLSVGFRQI